MDNNGKDWETIASYKCVRCGKIYHKAAPERCICRSPYEIGNRIGPFKIIGEKVEERIPVICLLCDSSKDLHYTAIKRQKSCGCKPKWIDVLEVSDAYIRYRCSKCKKTISDELPLMSFCCED